MANYDNNRTTLNFDGRPLREDEVLVLMPLSEEDRINITNPKSIVTVRTVGGSVPAVLKAVPKASEATARKQFNSYAREAKPVSQGRCLIPQPDGTKKVCPKKNGDNHPDCAHCPHRGEYEREMPRTVSLETLQEKGWDPASSCSPEDSYIKREEKKQSLQNAKDALNALLEASPKHGYALCLMVQKVKGEDFYEKMQLEHDAAAKVMNQISSYVKENGLHDFSHPYVKYTTKNFVFPYALKSWILYVISMRLSGNTVTRSMSRSMISGVRVSAFRTVFAAA